MKEQQTLANNSHDSMYLKRITNRYWLLARDAQAKQALIIAQHLSVHPSVLLCVRESFCSVANMVSVYSVYFLLITFYGRHSATINVYLDSSSILPLTH